MNVSSLDFLKDLAISNIGQWEQKLSPVTFSVFKKTNPPEPEWWVGSAKLTRSPVGIFYSDDVSASAGTSIFPREAMLRTIGETIERYSSTNSHLTDTVYARHVKEDLGFVRCAPFEQTLDSFKRNGIKDPIEHSRVTRLVDGSEEYLPFEYIHLGFIRYNKRFMHTSPISTGCAFYYDVNTAIWKGICEVVERDAMMRLWHTRGRATRISTNNVMDYSVHTRLKRIRNAGLTIHLYEISSVVNLPVVFAILEGPSFPYNCVGAACNADLNSAISKALDEAVSIRIMANWNHFLSKENYDYEDFKWVNRLEKHMELYANWKDTPAFDFLKKDQGPAVDIDTMTRTRSYMKAPTGSEGLVAIAEEFRSKGFDIYWKDVTVEEVRQFGHVIKVVIPQMIPLSQAHECRWLEPFMTDHTESTINHYPHPFA
jgi:ribosomal protein S12 methylthiotransferase accessory factor